MDILKTILKPGIVPVEKVADDVQTPKMFSVMLLNDPVTPAELVAQILNEVFGLNRETAWAKMMEAHRSGMSRVGVYTRDGAETRIHKAIGIASSQEYPLAFDLAEET